MDKQKQTPLSTERARAGAADRQRRQAEALRANLARRKDQTRTREENEPPPDASNNDGTAGT